MFRSFTRVAAAVAAAAVLSTLGATGASAGASVQAPHQRAATAGPAAGSGTRLWLAHYDNWSGATALAVSPDGSRVYVTGRSLYHFEGGNPWNTYATLAYNAATGKQLWASRLQISLPGYGGGAAVAVSPDGKRVYVTGTFATTDEQPARDYGTIAYDAATGKQLWFRQYNGPANRNDSATALAVSSDGGTVYVTGNSEGSTSGVDYATVAYSAAGSRLWVARYSGPGKGGDFATSLAVSPAGTVLVTGASWGGASGRDYATVAYGAAGTQLWARRYNGPGNSADGASAVAAPGNGKVYVTGSSAGATSGQDYATVGYSATGTRLWVRRYNGPGNRDDSAAALAVSPAGTVLVTGSSIGKASRTDYATIAYNPAGERAWAARYNGPANGIDEATSVAAPGNGKVYVTGSSAGVTSGQDYATIAYKVVTGAQLWARRYNGARDYGDGATSIGARAGRVFVTGSSTSAEGVPFGEGYGTIAYQG